MFGRESNYNELIREIFNDQADLCISEEDESQTYVNEESSTEDDFFRECIKIDSVTELICSHAVNHENKCLSAKNNITTEQLSYKAQFDVKVAKNRHSLREGDKFAYLNMPKLKSMKNAKYQDKWIGPYAAMKVTDSHVTISKDEINGKNDKKVPIDHVQLYNERHSLFPQKRNRGDNDHTDVLDSTLPCSSLSSSLFPSSITPNIDNTFDFFSRKVINIPVASNTSNNYSISNANAPDISNTPLIQPNIQDHKNLNYGFSEELIKIHLHTFKATLQLTKIESCKAVAENELKESEFWLNFVSDNITKTQMIKLIRDKLMNISSEIYPNYGTRKLAKFTTEVLYYEFMKYLDNNIWVEVKLTKVQHLFNNVIPKILCIDKKWQISKCKALGLTIISTSIQPTNFNGCELSKVIPWETQHIIGDGNCLFRAISWIVCGDESKHDIIRKLITEFIASNGGKTIGWLLNQLDPILNSPKNYLKTKMMHNSGVWGQI